MYSFVFYFSKQEPITKQRTRMQSMQTHVCLHAHTDTHTCARTRMHAHTCMHTHTHMHAHTHTCTHTHTHTHTCVRTYTHVCTYTHTPQSTGHLEEMRFQVLSCLTFKIAFNICNEHWNEKAEDNPQCYYQYQEQISWHSWGFWRSAPEAGQCFWHNSCEP